MGVASSRETPPTWPACSRAPVDAVFFGNAIHLVDDKTRRFGRSRACSPPVACSPSTARSSTAPTLPAPRGTTASGRCARCGGSSGAPAGPALTREEGGRPGVAFAGRVRGPPCGGMASTSCTARSMRCAWTSHRSRTSGATGSSSKARSRACRSPRVRRHWSTEPLRRSRSWAWIRPAQLAPGGGEPRRGRVARARRDARLRRGAAPGPAVSASGQSPTAATSFAARRVPGRGKAPTPARTVAVVDTVRVFGGVAVTSCQLLVR